MKTAPVYLVGTGVVGRAILKTHIDANLSVTLADQDADSLACAVDELNLSPDRWATSPLDSVYDWLPSITLLHANDSGGSLNQLDPRPVLIESISERLDIKQSFFVAAEKKLGDQAILCSNTSTLKIGSIAEKLCRPDRFGGMHFFMPVDQRPAVEVVRGPGTSAETINEISRHVARIGKQPLVVADGPGFIVNRLLCPYLNEAMLLLGRGVSASQIEEAALAYGMPMSPLELIDWIGTKTMFEAGRVFWQSFPRRIDPSPILPALIKAKRFGRSAGGGFYDYDNDVRSPDLSPIALELVQKYQRNTAQLTDSDVIHMLALPMWIEAAIAMRQGVAKSQEQFDLAMHGGLGFDSAKSWTMFFDSIGSERILDAIKRLSSMSASLKAPNELITLLEKKSPMDAFREFANATQ